MNTHTELKKIIIIVTILLILVAGIFYIRTQREKALQSQKTQNETAVVVPTGVAGAPVAEKLGVLRITPSDNKVKAGQPFTLTVAFEAPGKTLDGADVIMRFNPAFLEVTDITPGSYFVQYPRKTIDNVGGSVKLTGFSRKGNEALSADTLFSLSLKGKKTGKTQMTIDYQKGKTNLSTLVERKTSKNILGNVYPATITIEL